MAEKKGSLKVPSKGEGALWYPVLPLRDVVVFPHMVLPLFVGRAASIAALEAALEQHKHVILVAQKEANTDDPDPEALFDIGTMATLLQLLKLPDGTVKVLMEGLVRTELKKVVRQGDYLSADVMLHEEPVMAHMSTEMEVVAGAIIHQFDAYVRASRKVPVEVVSSLVHIQDPSRLADTLAAHMPFKVGVKQDLLSCFDLQARCEKLLGYIEAEIDLLQVEKRVRGRIKSQMEKHHRKWYLDEQLKALQKEKDELEGSKGDADQLEKKIKQSGMSKEAMEKATLECERLKLMSPLSAEATVARNYIDWLLALPWKHMAPKAIALDQAEAILNEDHYGLAKVKERIVEYLAVQQRVKKQKGPILCLVGPPGVGKTSLGESIARATNRPFVRMALGGVRDEAEIRGHRRTYVGSLPGKILQKIAKSKVNYPLFLLDEIDKMSVDFRGDPASALLEVLDPEQNHAFNDHYLEVDYDLSSVLFIATANSLAISPPLLDRMEVIRLPGYTEEEKKAIALRYIIPKQMKNHGLTASDIDINPEAVLLLLRTYTREAGVRNLEREIAKICRKVVKALGKKAAVNQGAASHIAESSEASPTSPSQHSPVRPVAIGPEDLKAYLGVSKYRYGVSEHKNQVGQVYGLAWTEAGGELLSVEAAAVPGKGKTLQTGHLGDVMKESIQTAMTVVRSRAESLGLLPDFYEKLDVHLHVPEGATPKDGPSAGIAMCTALVSALTQIPVRGDLAMTGEITLRGEVLPIGGLKEKLLAALRAGIKEVIIPQENEKELSDVSEIPANLQEALVIHSVRWIDEVLALALVSKPVSKVGAIANT